MQDDRPGTQRPGPSSASRAAEAYGHSLSAPPTNGRHTDRGIGSSRYTAPHSVSSPATPQSQQRGEASSDRLRYDGFGPGSGYGESSSNGNGHGTESGAGGGHTVLASYPRLRNQSEWIQLPSVSYGLSLYGEAPLREPLFSLAIRQQTKRGLAIGSSQMALRTARSIPLDPPPVCELLMNRSGDEHTLSLPEVFVRAQLVKAEEPYDEVLPDARRNEPLVGDTVQSPFNSRIESREDQCFFVFKEMGVRVKGIYRIRFDLFDRVSLLIRRVASVYSDAFEVHERRKHPGLGASSSLMDALVDRGMKYKLRKPINPKVVGKKRKPDQDDGYAEANPAPPLPAPPLYARYVNAGAYGRGDAVPSDAVAHWRSSQAYDRPSAAMHHPQGGWGQPDARYGSMAMPAREAADRFRPTMPRWNPEGAAGPRHHQAADENGYASSYHGAAQASSGMTATATATGAATKRVATMLPPPPDRIPFGDGRMLRAPAPMDAPYLRRPSLPDRNSSSSLGSGSSFTTTSVTGRPASSVYGSVTPSPYTSTSDEAKSCTPPVPTLPPSSSSAATRTKLPGFASLMDSAQLGPSTSSSSSSASPMPPYAQRPSSRSPPWFARPLDSQHDAKRRASDPRFPERSSHFRS
ncbi:uncharacterized protein PFL1_05560 [Pseudozyma flocculosa PF-1]|uniref:Velvet domain-containing protein n=2 Tax=Pseudozyma flocculosa TaxID=84751 RepID=A0A5C3FC22_9BASI|nr:uncharacterized protein PFL1_05560 [Pseudozyma flocculosa PF-1]EPQ26925.1 hypothetical protein PFL1_05560 [Pseudozyma flocculosa PF-1]SPO41167.1 uncharacterized protein PSFLO_06649 [Pseudozyma flocculosa]